MKFYEISYLVSPQSSLEELKSLEERISSLIQNEGGFLNEIQAPTKKNLAFSMKQIEKTKTGVFSGSKKQKEAFLSSLNFYLMPEKLVNLEKQLKNENQILRFLILSKKIIKKFEPGRKPIKMIEKKEEKTKKEKIELKDIEKKLEEILGK